jgi:hypothetical protein
MSNRIQNQLLAEDLRHRAMGGNKSFYAGPSIWVEDPILPRAPTTIPNVPLTKPASSVTTVTRLDTSNANAEG